MTCPACGIQNADGAAFCANCGTAMNSGSVATATADLGATAAPSQHSGGGAEPASDELLEMTRKELGGDYNIEKELGRGGMAVVYKGVERALERVVAIKVVPPESANAGQAAERFRREARLAASLDHANIIPVYRVGTAGKLHYMAMKFVEGRAVDAIIESQGALPVSVALAILRYSAAGLAFAHDKKIVHRDIKGANILVDKDGRVMVSDFGIARALEEVSLTASGMVIGTPYYMSPEQCGGQKISPQSDQYSLGILGFQMLTGEVPFNAESMVGVIQHHYMTPVPDIKLVRSDVPQELLDIVYCSLNKAPEDRFTTTKEMATALENVPQSETDREEAERLLKELSAGHAIPKVRTGTLPPLSLTISGPAAPVVPRPVSAPRKAQAAAPKVRKKKKKKNKMLLPMAATLLLAGGGGAWMMIQQNKADAARLAKEQADAAENAKGRIVIAGLPAGGRVLINNSYYNNGDTVPALPAGSMAASADAPGYLHWADNVTIPDSNKVLEVPFSLQRDPAANATASALQQAAPPPTRSGGNNTAAQSSPTVDRGTGTLRLKVTPTFAEIFVDGNRVGTGFKQTTASVGQHTIRFSAPGCGSPVEVQAEIKSKDELVIVPPVIIKDATGKAC